MHISYFQSAKGLYVQQLYLRQIHNSLYNNETWKIIKIKNAIRRTDLVIRELFSFLSILLTVAFLMQIV
jgi:hypothetical protein